ncbi:MAG: BlaI/MecI/CopY family transcriptional regulator [Thermoleophilaceae bacterium]
MGKRRDRDEPRRPAGSLEAEVMAALWAAGSPLTPGEVRADLGAGLAYTTVMTTLSRLHEKGAVGRRRAGRAYRYTPVMDQADIAAARMRAMLEAGADRSAVLARFVGSLSPQDERVVVDMLRERDGNEDLDP